MGWIVLGKWNYQLYYYCLESVLDHAFIFTSILCHEYPPNTKSHSWSTVFLCLSASCERLSLVFSMSESCLEAG